MPGCISRKSRNSAPENRSWTSQTPFHRISFTLVLEATYLPRNWSGMKITSSAPRDSTTCTALADVQQTSDSALTSAEVFT